MTLLVLLGADASPRRLITPKLVAVVLIGVPIYLLDPSPLKIYTAVLHRQLSIRRTAVDALRTYSKAIVLLL